MNPDIDAQEPAITLHRVAVVRPFVQFLESIGAPAKREFLRVGLPFQALDDVNNYIPSHRFREFLVRMAHSEGIKDLGFCVGERFGADNADPNMTRMLQCAPTLYSGLVKASQLVNKSISDCTLSILQPENSDYTFFCIQPSCSADDPVTEQLSWFGVMSLIDMARVYTGPQWVPEEIGVITGHSPSLNILETIPNTRFRSSQHYNYIAVENRLLSLPPIIHQSARSSPSLNQLVPLPNNFVSSLERALLSYAQSTNIDLEVASELAHMSKRTMQRKLADHGTQFSELRDNVRYQSAIRMLRDPTTKVADIAYRLSYSDTAHFSRAFRRIAGVSPRAFRQESVESVQER